MCTLVIHDFAENMVSVTPSVHRSKDTAIAWCIATVIEEYDSLRESMNEDGEVIPPYAEAIEFDPWEESKGWKGLPYWESKARYRENNEVYAFVVVTERPLED